MKSQFSFQPENLNNQRITKISEIRTLAVSGQKVLLCLCSELLLELAGGDRIGGVPQPGSKFKSLPSPMLEIF